MIRSLAIIALVLLAILLLSYAAFEYFEDGSYIIRGCLPWMVCGL